MAVIKVLVVDDSPFIHSAIRKGLDAERCEICGIGKNGKEGVELYEQLKPDLVTMDVTMPVMDGLQASEAILKKHADARIIMLSAMGDDELLNEAKKIGIRVFLKKPFKKEEMMTAINEVMGG